MDRTNTQVREQAIANVRPAPGRSDSSTPGIPTHSTEPPVNNATRGMLVVERIHCASTTEMGHDEVYYMLGGVNGDGQKTSYRGPDATQSGDADNQTAWDMNDSGDQQHRTLNARIYDEPLPPGKSATLALAFVESDGQDWGSTVAAAGKLASSVGELVKQPVYQIAGLIISQVATAIPKNQDDTLGAISLRLGNHGGTVVVEDLAPGAYSQITKDLDTSTGRFSVRFRHDDGDYTIEFRVTGR